MKIRADRKALAAALKRAKVENATTSLEVLNGLHFDAAGTTTGITGTNLDLTIATDLACEVVEKGDAVLTARLLRALVGAGTGEVVEISVEGGIATIASNDKTATVRTFRVDEWPKVGAVEGERFELTAADVHRLARLPHAVGVDPKRSKALLGVHFVGNRAEATDSWRLALTHLSVDGMPEVIVPVDVFRRVIAACAGGLTMTIGRSAVTFDSGDADTTWTTTVIVGDYPKVEHLIRRSSSYDLLVSKDALSEAIAYVKVLADEENIGVDLVREGDKLHVRAARQDVGDACATVPCAGSWEQVIRFNGKFLLDLLDNHDDDQVRFELEDALKPAFVRSSDGRTLLLQMPIRPGANP